MILKWITHQAGAALAAMVQGLEPVAVMASLLGAILPDLIDQKFAALGYRGKRQRIFNAIHRGSSHWFGWWLFAFTQTLAFMPNNGLAQFIVNAAMGISFGALTHVGMDMLTPRGTPLLPFYVRLRLSAPICSTGTWQEIIFLVSLVLCGILYFWADILAMRVA